MRFIAQLISIVFHPFFLPTYGLFFIIWSVPFLFSGFERKLLDINIIGFFALTFVFPVLALLIMKGLELIDSFQLRDKKDRIIPYIVISTFYVWTFWMFRHGSNTVLGTDPLVGNMMLGITLAVFAAFFINLWIKVSIHTLGMGGALGIAIILIPRTDISMHWPFTVLALAAGLVGMARLILKAHTPREVYYGYLIGFAGQYAALFLGKVFDSDFFRSTITY